MIMGIGLDAVDVARFTDYKKHKNLDRIFQPEEIHYCTRVPAKSAERFAARFAAKEALYKALTHINGGMPPCPFLQLCKLCTIIANPAPTAHISDWQALKLTPHTILITLTHTENLALAQVILQKVTGKS